MANGRIQDRLRARHENGRGALLPYLTAGFPDCATTIELIRSADSMGCSVVEVGFPFSDSIADGSVIQSSFHATLAEGHRLADTFRIAETIRPSVECGLVAMVSHSIVHRMGIDGFMERAAAAGFDGVIVPDVPVEESEPVGGAARTAALDYIGLVAPTTTTQRKQAIAERSSGFLYQIAVAGTTGARQSLSTALPALVAELKRISSLPVCVGFGISSPEHVREVCGYADGAIVGSAVVRTIEEGIRSGLSGDSLVSEVTGFLAALLAATE